MADELGGLSGLTGNPGTDSNGFHNTFDECEFADTRPGSALDHGGSLTAWRAFESADGNSQSGEIAVNADGHLPVDSPAIDHGQTLTGVTDNIGR